MERNATAGNIDWPEGGGGLFCYYSDLVLEDCTISDNSAGGNWSRGTGGGLEFAEDSTSATIINCTIADNLAEARGGGIYNWGDSLTAISCILWNNLPDQIFDYANPLSITHSDIQNGWPGEGNIDGDPRFVDPEGNDYHLGKKGRCGGGGDWGATAPEPLPRRRPRLPRQHSQTLVRILRQSPPEPAVEIAPRQVAIGVVLVSKRHMRSPGLPHQRLALPAQRRMNLRELGQDPTPRREWRRDQRRPKKPRPHQPQGNPPNDRPPIQRNDRPILRIRRRLDRPLPARQVVDGALGMPPHIPIPPIVQPRPQALDPDRGARHLRAARLRIVGWHEGIEVSR